MAPRKKQPGGPNEDDSAVDRRRTMTTTSPRRSPVPWCAFWALLVWSGTVVGSYCAFLSIEFKSPSDGARPSGSGAEQRHGVPGVVDTYFGLVRGERLEESDNGGGGSRRAAVHGSTTRAASSASPPPSSQRLNFFNNNVTRLPRSWSSSADPRPLRVTVATHPRSDMMGSFLVPSLLLLAVAAKYGWAVEILPYADSPSQRSLRELFALGHDIDPGWGSGMIDASSREGYDPAALNAEAHAQFGVLPDQPDVHLPEKDWVKVGGGGGVWDAGPPGGSSDDGPFLPTPGSPELDDLCRKKALIGNGYIQCHLLITSTMKLEDVVRLIKHIRHNGGPSEFFTPQLRTWMQKRFLAKNGHRIAHFEKGTFNVAVHVRRGDVSGHLKDRWIDQEVYAAVVRRICREHTAAANADAKKPKRKRKREIKTTAVHVFSSGKNRDGNWTALESTVDTCGSIRFHLDEYEFDTWAHFVKADALVVSRSAFSYVPALLNVGGEIHCPSGFLHLMLPHWKRFRFDDGREMPL